MDEFNPGPPREVHEDAAAREWMTAEKWKRETIRRLREDLGIWLSPMAETVISHGIRYAQEQAHAAGKAEGAAEERGRLTHVLQQAWDALSVVGSLELEESEVYRRTDDAVRSIDLAIRNPEAPDE